jgi:DnaJ-class molecular chaperone
LEHKISLSDSLNSKPVSFTTIDKEAFELSLDSVISPDYVKVIEDKGMPVYNEDPLMPIKRDF